MSRIELAATILGFINVFLTVRRNIWNYPFGIAMVLLYVVIFYDARLYSDALLQIYFLLIQIYGWVEWSRGRSNDGELIVEVLTPRGRWMVMIAIAIGAGCLGWFMAHNTDASFPLWDALATTTSVVAQFLLSRRFIENWLLWIFVDVLSIGLYIAKDLWPTTGLYLAFLTMAVWGLIEWRRTLALQQRVTEAAKA